MLDSDLATIYGVSTKALNQAVRRNPDRFPADFMFQLSEPEAATLRSQSVTSKIGRGGRRYQPIAFTEHGAVMLSAVLRSSTAVKASVLIARAFVRLRRLAIAHKDLARRLDRLEGVVAGQRGEIGELFDALRRLIDEPLEPAKKIGF
jgi:hypothetical protein